MQVGKARVHADPYVGTWKVNTAESKYKTGVPYKEQTATISESGNDLDVVMKATAANGAAFSLRYTSPANGGTGKIIESSSYDAVSTKRLSDTEWETSFSKGGKVAYTALAKLSKDGKTITIATKGTNAAGQMVEGTSVYEKQ